MIAQPIKAGVCEVISHLAERIAFALSGVHEQDGVLRDGERAVLLRVDMGIVDQEQPARGERVAGLLQDLPHLCLVPIVEHIRDKVRIETSGKIIRKDVASHYLDAHPGDLVGLAGLLGHSSLDTTRIYTQPTADEIAERLERLDLNAFGG